MEWHIYIDGASSCNPGHSGAGLVVYNEHGDEVTRQAVYLGEMTNNMAEYEALLHALRKARESSIGKVFVYTDSLLVTNQILGVYKIKNMTLKKYADEAQRIIRTLDHFTVKYIPRELNRIADKLAKEAITTKG